MDTKNNILSILNHDDIKNKIYTIRGIQVMLDSDLAELYETETRILNQSVRRNIDRFPLSFMFQLTKIEFEILMSQNVISKWGGVRKLPFVFTEQGVSMLSAILTSKIAVQVSIQIINAFVEMRKFISINIDLLQRVENLEIKQIQSDIKFLDHDKNFDKVFEAMEQNEIKPKQGIFFDGQIFDAYKFVSDMIRRANKSIVIIDNFVDDRVFLLLTKRQKGVKATIFTKNISRELILDLNKHNAQYPAIELKEFSKVHDRFIILDAKEVYHFGASLKDLGTKWFAFSKMKADSLKLIEKIEKL
jgi:hypothetical protein